MPAQAEKVFLFFYIIKHVFSVYFFQWIENIFFAQKIEIGIEKNIMLVNGVINIYGKLIIFDL